jgi:hypothetical protein
MNCFTRTALPMGIAFSMPCIPFPSRHGHVALFDVASAEDVKNGTPRERIRKGHDDDQHMKAVYFGPGRFKDVNELPTLVSKRTGNSD